MTTVLDDLEKKIKFLTKAKDTPDPSEFVDKITLDKILSKREREVFLCILNQLSARDIARSLYISENTAKHHITNIGRKFNARGRSEILARARLLGVIVTTPLVIGSAAANGSREC